MNRAFALGSQTREHTVKVWSRKWLFALCGALAAVLFVGACIFLYGPAEPVYKGIGLSKWLDGSYTHNLRVGSAIPFSSPNVVIPILISELTNSTIVDTAIDVLQRQFGPVATPKLYPVALRETGIIRPAEVALEHADPVAYRKLQIEKERLGVR